MNQIMNEDIKTSWMIELILIGGTDKMRGRVRLDEFLAM